MSYESSDDRQLMRRRFHPLLKGGGLTDARPVREGECALPKDAAEAQLTGLGSADPALEVEGVHRSRSNTDLISSSWAPSCARLACIAASWAIIAFTCAGLRLIIHGFPSGGIGIPRAPA